MIEEQAVVIDVNGSKVSVEAGIQSNCGHCSAASGCGTSLLGKFFARNRPALVVETDLSLSTGDKVVLGLDDDALLQGSVIVYATPLIMMLVLPMMASYFFTSELASIFFGIIGLVAGLIYVKCFSVIARNSERFRPVVLRQID